MENIKRSGFIVTTQDGKTGRTYHDKGTVNGKIPVYLEISKFKYSETAILCRQETLKTTGFID